MEHRKCENRGESPDRGDLYLTEAVKLPFFLDKIEGRTIIKPYSMRGAQASRDRSRQGAMAETMGKRLVSIALAVAVACVLVTGCFGAPRKKAKRAPVDDSLKAQLTVLSTRILQRASQEARLINVRSRS